MILQALFPRDIFAELERLQRDMQQNFDVYPNIRGRARGNYPALNVGGTAQSVDIYAFAPGLDPARIDVQLEKGVLTIAGERPREQPAEQATVHIDERFAGRFRRVVNLPEDIDPDTVQARYTDGVLHVSVQRRQAAQTRRIPID